jgi:hypothetical protein
MEEILAFEINLRPAKFAGKPLGKVKRRGPSSAK